MLATLAFLGIKNIHTMNAYKSFLGSCINGVAIIPFIFAGVIAWKQTILMASSASFGGYLCARLRSQARTPLDSHICYSYCFEYDYLLFSFINFA